MGFSGTVDRRDAAVAAALAGAVAAIPGYAAGMRISDPGEVAALSVLTIVVSGAVLLWQIVHRRRGSGRRTTEWTDGPRFDINCRA